MMVPSAIQLLLIWAVGCCWNVAAQWGFSIPNPNVVDDDPSNTIVQGTVANFAWGVNFTWQPTINGGKVLDSNGHVSLWLTSWTSAAYTQCLAPSVYSGGGGTWAYKVSISDDDIDANGGKFVYRLKPTVSSQSAQYPTTEDEVPSRGFLIEKASDAAAAASSSAAAASASSASVAAAAAASRSVAAAQSASQAAAQSASQAAAQSASQAQAQSASQAAAQSASQAAAASQSAAEASSASVAAQTTAQSSVTPTSAAGVTSKAKSSKSPTGTAAAAAATSTNTGGPTPVPSPNNGLSAGAKAGIAIGVIALALLAAIALLLFLRYRKRTAANAAAQPPPAALPPPVMAQPKDYAEHNRHSAPQFMGQPQSPQQQQRYPVPSPPPQVYGAPDPGAAEMGAHGGYPAHELPNPHGYGYGAELPAYDHPQ